jgi:VCBS repeat protein
MKHAILIVGLALVLGATVLLAGDAVAPVTPQTSALVSFAKAINVGSPLLYPSSLAAGDLNHSGIPGLAVVSVNNSVPLVYALGKGDGRFGAWRQDRNVGYAPGFVLLADVDGDGNLDAITTDILAGDLNVTFGDGEGHLYGGKRLLVGGVQSTYIVAVADVNGDGVSDIVGTTNSGIFVILGKGSRKFAKAVTFGSGGQSPYGIAVGDLNHDGIPDLIVANYGTEQNGDYGNVAVLLGKGNGSFDPPVRYPIGKYEDPFWLALGDFNGNLGVAVTTQNSNAVHVLLGRGDGTLSPPRSFPAGLDPFDVVSADFNGDGIPDLAVTNYSNPKPCHVSVMLGNGDGTFQPPVQFRVGVSPAQLVVADFNHDGKPDIATINGGDSTISILLNATPFPTPSHAHRGRGFGL